jgi:hypothetical protein
VIIFYKLITKMISVPEWFEQFMASLFCLVACWEPGKDFEKNFAIRQMSCFIVNVFQLFPNTTIRNYGLAFLQMDDSVIDILEDQIPRFFRVFPYLEIMKNEGENFFTMCLNSSDHLFNWLYMFQTLVLTMLNKQGHNITIPTLNEMRTKFNPKDITKTDWGRPTWSVIHMTALYCPSGHEHFKVFHDMLSCLRYVLPCPKCRNHLAINLQYIDFKNCGKDNDSGYNVELFKCTWQLHNIVNQSLQKPLIGFREALRLYS